MIRSPQSKPTLHDSISVGAELGEEISSYPLTSLAWRKWMYCTSFVLFYKPTLYNDTVLMTWSENVIM